ncbi:MAG: DUF4175 domain-containing protein [Deltaproteobacteria bacterium]|nr:MAG: DUF4175 domain-containing protein [Deltaproteobacteria bacterium]TMA55784.1 MAG: DUF4175 domain-containing protein [Deltaproteobacteria bacterium]
MSDFSDCFLLVFGQLAVGGLAALAVPPFSVLQRGFYKSSACVFLGCALLFLAGKAALVVRAGGVPPARGLELALWSVFAASSAVYLAALWREEPRLRARAYPAALFLGVAALFASAGVHRLGPLLSPAAVLYPLSFLTGALALGAVATGMLLGHWYLIDLGLSIEPLQRLFRYFVAVLILHLAVLAVTLAVMGLAPGPGTAAVTSLWHEHRSLLAARFLLGPLAALGLGYLIDRTLRIPQTMAATGLFYIAILAVMVGELLGRLILFRTSLPL